MNDTQTVDVAVVGATGAVGEVMVSLLEERDFPLLDLYPLASDRSVGNRVLFRDKYLSVGDTASFDFSQVQIVLLAAGAEASAQYAPLAVAAGCVVIDSSACYRADDDVPLVVPEVNASAVGYFSDRRIIASPNAVTIAMLVALKPIIDAVGILRINVATYQAVSGAGQAAVKALAGQTVSLLNMRAVETASHDKQIAFNVLGRIGGVLENGYTREEMEMVWESQKVLGDDAIVINPTAVRVPVFFGDGLALHIETKQKMTARQARELLKRAAGVEMLAEAEYPSAVSEAAGNDAVFVGRVREDISHPQGLDMWVVADNVRKGAALNSVQIAEILVKDYL